MRCVQIDAAGFVVDVQPQPAETSACALVLVDGGDAGLFVLPPTEQLTEVFSWSFALVAFSGLIGYIVGRFARFWE
ncbi:MAG: hypothetical protein E6R11_00430 [Rhodocyclaceae bacterium]|nr:MAG: hypothetical protein E6R11_00430 [Rhodocyclaceae bacterium]